MQQHVLNKVDDQIVLMHMSSYAYVFVPHSSPFEQNHALHNNYRCHEHWEDKKDGPPVVHTKV